MFDYLAGTPVRVFFDLLTLMFFKDVRCETRIHIKGFKRSLVKNIYLDELSTASLQSIRRRLQTGSRKLVQINIFNQ